MTDMFPIDPAALAAALTRDADADVDEPSAREIAWVATYGPGDPEDALRILVSPQARRILTRLWADECPTPDLLGATVAAPDDDADAELRAHALRSLLTLHTRTCPTCRSRLAEPEQRTGQSAAAAPLSAYNGSDVVAAFERLLLEYVAEEPLVSGGVRGGAGSTTLPGETQRTEFVFKDNRGLTTVFVSPESPDELLLVLIAPDPGDYRIALIIPGADPLVVDMTGVQPDVETEVILTAHIDPETLRNARIEIVRTPRPDDGARQR